MASLLASHILVEALADEEGVDSSILKAAISCVPNFWIDASSTLREKVALRYLEECSGFDRADVSPAVSGSRTGIDVARSVEEVLSSHLMGNGWTWIDYEMDRETEAVCNVTKSSLEKGGDVDEFTRHDLHQFITQKRASLPKFSLDLPKEPTLEDNCQIAPSLEETSGSSGQRDHLQRNNDIANEKNNVDIILETPSDSDRPDGGDSDGSVAVTNRFELAGDEIVNGNLRRKTFLRWECRNLLMILILTEIILGKRFWNLVAMYLTQLEIRLT